MGDIADAEERLQNPTLGNPEKPQADDLISDRRVGGKSGCATRGFVTYKT